MQIHVPSLKRAIIAFWLLCFVVSRVTATGDAVPVTKRVSTQQHLSLQDTNTTAHHAPRSLAKFNINNWHKCSPFDKDLSTKLNSITISRKGCKKRCLAASSSCKAFLWKKKEKNGRKICWLIRHDTSAVAVTQRKNRITCGLLKRDQTDTEEPNPTPSSLPVASASAAPSFAPSSLYITRDELMSDGNGVSFPSDIDVQLQSNSSAQDEFGVVITTHAFNADDVDFKVDYTQTSFADVQSNYESQLILFFATSGTYPEMLLQSDNDFANFTALIAGFLKSKIHTTLDYTWFYSGTKEASGSDSTAKHLRLSLRIRRLNNTMYSYFQEPSDQNWQQIGSPLALPSPMHDAPLQFGYRVKKEWQVHHNFTVRAQKLAGGSPLPIPTRAPTMAPTEKRTWINPGTNYKEPVCPTTLDRSGVSGGNPYEVRGVGGGGAMSGLSISPWNNHWFVGTDMGTLFRSNDAGALWYPVSHYEAKYHSHLPVSAPVGFTTNPAIVVHATCHRDVANRDCVAQRSIDSGLTWNPINITGGTRVDYVGGPVLDHVPMQWTGSLIENSGFVYVTCYETGHIYKSIDDGGNWTYVDVPFNNTNPAVGIFLDETSATTRYIYFATSHGVFMWKDGEESEAREIWAPDGNMLLQSFTGARSELGSTGSSLITLAFIDSDNAACNDKPTQECGYVHIVSAQVDSVAAETHDFVFIKTDQKGFRVVSSPSDAELLYVTGARSWPDASGTSVWVGSFNEEGGRFDFTLKFRQYPRWDSDKLDYSGVGLDVGYWDGGYYMWAIHPKNSSIAGGSGNFFLHVTRNAGNHWESPFTEYADGCNTNDERLVGRRWRSTGLEMTSVRWLQFNPYNTSYAFASVADIRMLRSDDRGETFEITGGDKFDPLFILNTVYDYDFAGPHTVFAVGGNFHDWPHEWYKNLIRGAGGVFVSFNSGDNWHRVGSEESINCDDRFIDVDCRLGDDMRRQILSVFWDESIGGGSLFVGTQSAGVARLQGLKSIMETGTIEQMQDLRWEWINTGLGSETGRIIPEIKKRNGVLYCLLTGNAPYYNNTNDVGIYEFNHTNSSWEHKRGSIIRHPSIDESFSLWAYPTSFDIDQSRNLWLADIEANGNYLASGIWKSSNDGDSWDRMQQFTFPYHITAVGDRIYASGGRSISHIGNAGWGDGGAFHSDDNGTTWAKNEVLPLLSNLNSVVVDPTDGTKVFYTFFGGGLLHGPKP